MTRAYPKLTSLGSFGTYPKEVGDKFRAYQAQSEARPCSFHLYDFGAPLDESREALEDLVNAPRDTVVFVGNATEGVNTVFRNLQWNEDGKDVIIFFSTIYEACAKVADFVVDYFGTSRVTSKEIQLQYPLEDDEIIQRFRNTVAEIEAAGKRARVCVFDVVSSKPGVVFPWEKLCKVCKELGVLSLVDGAQGVGMVKLDLSKADPDFFTSNCHKWLFVPRGCAMFYVPKRNQHLITTTLATSHGYVPKTAQRDTPLPPKAKSLFVSNFEFTGTKDVSGYLAVKDAIAWRRDVCGGEEMILAYLWALNKRGTKHVAEKLGTKVLENSKGTLTNCGLGNVALPVWIGETKGGEAQDGDALIAENEITMVKQWMFRAMMDEYKTFMMLYAIGDRLFVRISAQIYLDMKDYEFAAKVLGDLCSRVAAGEYKK